MTWWQKLYNEAIWMWSAHLILGRTPWVVHVNTGFLWNLKWCQHKQKCKKPTPKSKGIHLKMLYFNDTWKCPVTVKKITKGSKCTKSVVPSSHYYLFSSVPRLYQSIDRLCDDTRFSHRAWSCYWCCSWKKAAAEGFLPVCAVSRAIVQVSHVKMGEP